jgi:hypothetical protein
MLFQDSIRRPTGRFRLKIYRAGRLVEDIDEPNLVVTGASQVNAHLVGGTVATNSVTQFGVGTNGTAPVVGNTVLTAPFLKAVDGVTYPGGGLAVFAFSLGTAEANGMTILEFGLLTAGGVLYARKNRAGGLSKAADISFAGTWSLQF